MTLHDYLKEVCHNKPSNPLDVCSKTREKRVWTRRPSIKSATEDMPSGTLSTPLSSIVFKIVFKAFHKLV